MNAKQQEKQEAIEELRKLLHPGDTVYTILRHVSRSGMTRIIDPVLMREDGPRSIAHLAAKVLGDPLDRDLWGVKQTGCGMDMGFNLVYNLGYYLFPDGFKVEGRGRNGDMSGWDNDGGYALSQKWL